MARRPPEQTANPARGAVLVVVAVLIGLVLLRHGLDTDTTGSDRASDQTTTTKKGSTDTSSTVAARDKDELAVVVLNGSTVNGKAAAYADSLKAKGWSLAAAANGGRPLTTASKVLFAAGFEDEAGEVATALGTAAGVAAPDVSTLADSQPTSDAASISTADIVVWIGTDLSGKTPS